jgi:hypothetical protein
MQNLSHFIGVLCLPNTYHDEAPHLFGKIFPIFFHSKYSNIVAKVGVLRASHKILLSLTGKFE